jgi:enediyne biosynthesis protein E4
MKNVSMNFGTMFMAVAVICLAFARTPLGASSAENSCTAGSSVPSSTTPSSPTRGHFVDVTEKLGIHFRQQASPTSKKYLLETMGSGVALFDYDNDGRLDIFFANGARIDDPTPKGTIPKKDNPKYWNRLYHQKSDGTFEDVTERTGLTGFGYSTGVAVGDYDNDGFEDLYVAGYGRSTLYHNNGDGTFTDVTAAAGVAGSGWMTSAAWVDYDNDGRLDLVVARYMQWDFDDIFCGRPGKDGYRSYCHPDAFKPESVLLFHNDGGGKFTEVTHEAGIDKPGKGLGLAIADYDHDGFMDILLSNDSMPEYLFHNRGNGTFEEVGLTSGAALDSNGNTFAGMGVDFQDYNNDGWPDIIITDLARQRYALYTNLKDGTFDYSTTVSGLNSISLMHSGWGVRFFDYDNDGWKDLFIVQSHVIDTIEMYDPNVRYREPPVLLHNERGKNFVDVSALSGNVFSQQWAARGLAIGDINNDGEVDAVVTSNDGPAWVLLNQTDTSNHWIILNLIGTKSNRDAIGAQVRISTSGGDQFATVTTCSSYQSSSDRRLHFGLGAADFVREIEIRWPSGIRQVLQNSKSSDRKDAQKDDLKVDRILTIREPLK